MPPGSKPLTASSRCIPSTMGVWVVPQAAQAGLPAVSASNITPAHHPAPFIRDTPFSIRGFAVSLPLDALGQSGSQELIDIPIQNSTALAGFDTGPQILHHLVGLQHVGTDLVPPADIRLGRFK